MSDALVKGTLEEQSTFSDLFRHYTMSREDLDQRIKDMDKKDILFRSHIVKKKWPYRSVVFDPIIFTALYEKTARTFANKPRGRMLPREGGDAIGAKINNELLSFQWDDNERVDGQSMLVKWALMDLQARKYGASFALCKWHWQRQVQRLDDKTGKSKIFFDGPNFKPWNNRDVLHNPSYSTIKNWIQLRDYVTFQDLANTNDAARSKPVYKNLDILKDALIKESKAGGDRRDSNYVVKNLTLKGLTDYLGADPLYKTIEIVTEYRNDRWLTFAPKHGVILRDIPNPYDHGQIPVVLLKYYPIDDDIYGLSEIEPVERLQRAHNAYINQNLDQLNLDTFTPLKVRNTNGAVQMHTLEFAPGKKWLMNDPATDVLPHTTPTKTQQFVEVFRLMKASILEGLGETSAGISNTLPGSGKKTATEIKDSAISRTARDNFNQIMLGEAMKKQMMFWFTMNQQYFFNPNEKQKVIRIVGKDAIKFFQNAGLDANGLNDESEQLLDNQTKINEELLSNRVQHIQDNQLSADDQMNLPGLDLVDLEGLTTDLQSPLYPVETPDGIGPKMEMDEGGQGATLIIEKEDLAGNYDYIPDVGSMGKDSTEEAINAKGDFLSRVTGVDPTTGQPTGIARMMQQEGKRIKATDLLVDYAEDIGFKNADQYIENIPQQPAGMGGMQIDPITGQPIQGGVIPGGAGGAETGAISAPNGQLPGVQAGVAPMA
jgi:hypothetical protein